MWAVELSDAAAAALFGLDRREAEHVSFNLFKLAEDPAGLSAEPAAYPIGRDFAFRQVVEGRAVWFFVLWQYKREEIVHVLRILREVKPNDPA